MNEDRNFEIVMKIDSIDTTPSYRYYLKWPFQGFVILFGGDSGDGDDNRLFMRDSAVTTLFFW